MGRRADPADADRYLALRESTWHYKRKVPGTIGALDERGPTIRMSLKTRDLAEARRKRDALEAADNELWASMLLGDDGDVARRRYKGMVKRAEAMGLIFRPIETIAQGESLEALFGRFLAIRDERTTHQAESAALGTVSAPAVTVTEAFRIYCDEIMPAELAGKSDQQRAAWKKVKKRAVENFKRVIGGDPVFSDIPREDGLKFYQHWMGRVAPTEKGARPTASASSGNRDLGNMRELFRSYHIYIGDRDRPNPFDGLSFAGAKKSRPPFTIEFMKTRILRPRVMQKLNAEARGIFLMVVAIGARPSEICNLLPADIHLDAKVPYIDITAHEDEENRREIKTASSRRQVPLVGLALAVMKAHPSGFPRYRHKEENLSATLNKWMNTNDLLPTPKHKPYSARHTFEDIMKVGGIDEELRRILMGHSIQRPRYGAGGTLEWRAGELERIALPFDPGII